VRTLTIYYGWLSDKSGAISANANRIIRTSPELLVAAYKKADGSPNIIEDFVSRKGKMKIYSYIATQWTRRDITDVASEIVEVSCRSDGVFLDEVSAMQTDSDVDYYSKLHELAKKCNLEVICNPGMVALHRKIMETCEILCLEHQWMYIGRIPWRNNYPSSRFMGVSTPQIQDDVFCSIDEKSAVNAAKVAAELGIGYHYSATALTDLDPWYEGYIERLRRLRTASSRSSFPWLHEAH